MAEAISLIVSLLQLIRTASDEVAKLSALIEKANAEGRDLTDAELDEVRALAAAARAKFVAA